MQKITLPLSVGGVTVGGAMGSTVSADGVSVRIATGVAPSELVLNMNDDNSRATLCAGVDVYRFRGGLAFFSDGEALCVLSGNCIVRTGGEELTLAAGEALTALKGKIGLEAATPTTVVRVSEEGR